MVQKGGIVMVPRICWVRQPVAGGWLYRSEVPVNAQDFLHSNVPVVSWDRPAQTAANRRMRHGREKASRVEGCCSDSGGARSCWPLDTVPTPHLTAAAAARTAGLTSVRVCRHRTVQRSRACRPGPRRSDSAHGTGSRSLRSSTSSSSPAVGQRDSQALRCVVSVWIREGPARQGHLPRTCLSMLPAPGCGCKASSPVQRERLTRDWPLQGTAAWSPRVSRMVSRLAPGTPGTVFQQAAAQRQLSSHAGPVPARSMLSFQPCKANSKPTSPASTVSTSVAMIALKVPDAGGERSCWSSISRTRRPPAGGRAAGWLRREVRHHLHGRPLTGG